jgi:hypothetical protein
MDTDLHPSLRPFLSALDEDDSFHASRLQYLGDEGSRVSLHLPTYKLKDGIELWQMTDHCSFEVLSELLHSQNGAIIQLSSTVCAVFCVSDALFSIRLERRRRGQGRTPFVPTGPAFESFWRLHGD